MMLYPRAIHNAFQENSHTMKQTNYKFHSDLPYSLHDMLVNKISIHNDAIKFSFVEGFVELTKPYPLVPGTIEIQGADLDFCCVYILSRFGYFGGFRGKKMALTEFLSAYPHFQFEIVDELHGYNQVVYNGYLSTPGNTVLREMELSMYYTGEIIYRTEGE